MIRLLLPLLMAAPAFSATPTPEPDIFTQEYMRRVAAFAEENGRLDPQERYFVFVGDSITQSFPLDRYFPDWPTLNRGIMADGIRDYPWWPWHRRGVLNRFDESIGQTQPRIIFLLIGTNHVLEPGIEYTELIVHYEELLDRTLSTHPGVPLVVHTVPPMGTALPDYEAFNAGIAELNPLIAAAAAERGLPLVDLADLMADEEGKMPSELTTDGVHFTEEGYELWANALREAAAAQITAASADWRNAP